ncbi:MAG: trans-aconitate methyltransferase [Rhodobacterales bacterium CG2_30_65_12]|nr:MAG: trans-aconitate methyltransferase [Rhodobacterales bacterium CG2_30_65_12]
MSPFDWNPGTYARFRGLRLRPALDLLARVDDIPPGGPVVDLGCGAGAVGPVLAKRYPDHRLIGIDASPAMLAEAGKTGAYDWLSQADIAGWMPAGEKPALIYANAVLHWLGAHEDLMPRLAGLLAPGGVLAVQMPGQFDAASHRLLRETAGEMFPDRFEPSEFLPSVAAPEDYARLLAPLGRVEAWETTYVQRLDPAVTEHPVRRFTEATAMRPFLERMSAAEAGNFISAYEAELSAAYPVEEDGTVLFAFRRVFFTLTRL